MDKQRWDWRGWMRAAVVPMVALALAGCSSVPFGGPAVAPYEPQISAAERAAWLEEEASAAVDAGATAIDGSTTTSSGMPRRFLRRDDRILISMRGIPRPEEIADVVDGSGNVKLPYVGALHVEGLTTGDAEELIERAFIEGGYYNKIDVIIVAQEEAYFVRGEVMRPGKYPLAGDTTVLMAISSAGGYTDFANSRKIRVIRGEKVEELNGARIEQRKDDDFLVEPNDIIIVERKILL